MKTELLDPPALPFAKALVQAETLARPRLGWRAIATVWKFAVGLVLCQSLAGAVLVAGWTARLVQRIALRAWWRRSAAARSGETFEAFVAGGAETAGHRHWPNWIVAQNARSTLRRMDGETGGRYVWRCVRVSVASFWRNTREGFQMVANSSLLLLPGSALMLFSWYSGWHNSFNKGYEQHSVGITLGVTGIILWLGAMLYVPLAQARQAVTGEWRAFYDFRFVWRLARARWAECVALAGFFSAAMLPVSVVRAAPSFLPQAGLNVDTMTSPQVVELLNAIFFWSAIWLLIAFVVVRVAAGWIYARGILAGLKSGRIGLAELRPFERAVLERLELQRAEPSARRHVLVRVATNTSRFVVRPAAIIAALLVWFTVIVQLYVQQFFNYIPSAPGWLVHPLAQAPTIRFIPPHLQSGPQEP